MGCASSDIAQASSDIAQASSDIAHWYQYELSIFG